MVEIVKCGLDRNLCKAEVEMEEVVAERDRLRAESEAALERLKKNDYPHLRIILYPNLS